MTTIPKQDERFRDSGRRVIEITGRPVSAAKDKLRADEIEEHFPATEQIVYRITPGANARAGMIVQFDGQSFKVCAVADPFAKDDLMKRKFVKLIVQPI